MIIELANFCFFIVIALCLLQIYYNAISLYRGYYVNINFNILIFILLSFDFIALLYSFYLSDFSVALVAESSSSLKPTIYRLASIWASYSGSLFFWFFLISFYAIYTNFYKKLAHKEKSILMLIIGCFMAIMAIFIGLFANPFTRILPALIQGNDTNPLLEDLSLVIHPPLLYLGYAALFLSFCCTIAALLLKNLSENLQKLLCFYNKTAWIFLFFSMLTGSYWAYYELGWGGYWSFDPVENYALMPWLCSLAVLHKTKKTIFFSLLAFSLTMIGTFFARTNFVFSVHSFMGSFSQNIAIFLFILIMLVPGWIIFFKNKIYFQRYRDDKSLLYYFYILIIIIVVSLLIAQIIPLIYNLLTINNIYVNSKYYYYSFVPLAFIAIIFMLYTTVTNLHIIYMLISHSGILCLTVAIILSSLYSYSQIAELKPNEQVNINNIKIKYLNKHNISTKNYFGAEYDFMANNKAIKAQNRNYLIQNQQTIIVGLANFGLSQIYIIPQQEQNNKLLIKIDYNFSILAIWLGGALCILGALLRPLCKKSKISKL